MRGFYQAFPIRDALRRELSWTHYRLLLRVDSAEARQWYVQEAAAQNWSTRALERQIGSLYYERLLLSQDKAAVSAETQANLAALASSPRAFVRDPVMLEFLGLPGAGRLLEATLETALMDKLQQFLMELVLCLSKSQVKQGVFVSRKIGRFGTTPHQTVGHFRTMCSNR